MKCEVLVDALNGNYRGTYCDFERSIIQFVENYMHTFCENRYYFPVFFIKRGLSTYGNAIGTDKILLNQKIIQELMNGNKLCLFVIFHELSHIEQHFQMENGVATSNVLRYIKDLLLSEYQKEENQESGLYYLDSVFDFYEVNYENDSREIDANINAILLTIQFFVQNHIECEYEKSILENYFNQLLKRKKKKRNLKYCVTFNSYYLTLEDAFDVAIFSHPEWLTWYPQLREEYDLIDGVVRKRPKMTNEVAQEDNYQYYKISNKYSTIHNEYHKVKYFIKK